MRWIIISVMLISIALSISVYLFIMWHDFYSMAMESNPYEMRIVNSLINTLTNTLMILIILIIVLVLATIAMIIYLAMKLMGV